MQQVNDILEPAETFERVKEAFNANVDEYWKNLLKSSRVDINQNEITCDEIYETQDQVNKIEKKRKGHKIGKGFSIFGSCVGFIAVILSILVFTKVIKWPTYAGIILLIGGLALGIGLILLVCLYTNKAIKANTEEINELNKIIQAKTEEAWKQMENLNNSFTWNIPQKLITDTVPLIKLDRSFEPYRYYQLIENYNFNPEHSIDESTICVQSGEIQGNPFLFEKTIYTYIGNWTYTGSITITWTTHGTDSKGNPRTETHTQVLTASVTKPRPFYEYTTNLIYGNQAAPELCFERSPIDKKASKMSDKQMEKYVKRKVKKLDKLEEKALKDGGTYTKTAYDEFEVLFNCTERNNEQQFRLLFTPIGQTNMVELFKRSPYGDDFEFVKDKMINLIHSGHSQSFEYHSAPWLYRNFDHRTIEKFFKEYTNNYLQSVYFDLCPILSIPLYQQYKTHDYIYKQGTHSNLTFHEVESLCNYYGVKHFAHPDTATNTILKCEFWDKDKNIDNAIIHAYSYKSITHVEHIAKMGGDGHMHDVPVVWYEYIPLVKSTKVRAIDENGYLDVHKNGNIAKDLNFHVDYTQKGISLTMK